TYSWVSRWTKRMFLSGLRIARVAGTTRNVFVRAVHRLPRRSPEQQSKLLKNRVVVGILNKIWSRISTATLPRLGSRVRIPRPLQNCQDFSDLEVPSRTFSLAAG